MDINYWIVPGVLIILLAGFVQGVTSFGFALISLPLLTLFLPLQQVVPLIVILSLLTNIAILFNCYKHVIIHRIGLLVLSGIAAVPLGSYLLIYVNEAVLKVFAGAFIALVAVFMLMGKTYPVRNEKLAFVSVGLASGLLNGSISLSGPPVALFLSNQGTDKQTFRANLTVYALILNVFTISTFLYNGLLNRAVASALSWMIPAMIVGVVLGIWTGSKINEKIFKRLVLVLIMVSGVWTIVTGL
ncbi:Sulfite exporter TauE/SafE [compost metagenome]